MPETIFLLDRNKIKVSYIEWHDYATFNTKEEAERAYIKLGTLCQNGIILCARCHNAALSKIERGK